ncbi:hypothetical protein BDM02DRAFT_3186027 [Thelephora ganbajun]|uniref:Uncharacterized protein n=1 Tax=Thelephora ganbajun TaxID=370292 RepID=A0ACB6ZK87_THEGA|nr:hypothetical protein BDM02DRAFT_3186027 [Thelephora ganbajun]
MDIRDSRRLLVKKGHSSPSCFSSDGGLLADDGVEGVRVWKYTSDGYAKWREFSTPRSIEDLRFSPTSSSLSSCTDGVLKLWRLDGPPIDGRHDSYGQLVIVSHCGGYIVAGHRLDNAVTVTNLLSQTPPCVVDTGMKIDSLTLTGNVLLVLGHETIAAWRLTGEGMVDGVLPGGRAGRGNAIWTIPTRSSPDLFVQDQTVKQERYSSSSN